MALVDEEFAHIDRDVSKPFVWESLVIPSFESLGYQRCDPLVADDGVEDWVTDNRDFAGTGERYMAEIVRKGLRRSDPDLIRSLCLCYENLSTSVIIECIQLCTPVFPTPSHQQNWIRAMASALQRRVTTWLNRPFAYEYFAKMCAVHNALDARCKELCIPRGADRIMVHIMLCFFRYGQSPYMSTYKCKQFFSLMSNPVMVVAAWYGESFRTWTALSGCVRVDEFNRRQVGSIMRAAYEAERGDTLWRFGLESLARSLSRAANEEKILSNYRTRRHVKTVEKIEKAQEELPLAPIHYTSKDPLFDPNILLEVAAFLVPEYAFAELKKKRGEWKRKRQEAIDGKEDRRALKRQQ